MTYPLTKWRLWFSRVNWRLEFKAADCWIGVYWADEVLWRDVWICIIPMLPIHAEWYYDGFQDDWEHRP